MKNEFTCPSCGFLVFDEPPGSYAICPICNWEDDHVQLRFPGMRGGANGGSLFEYQQDILKEIPVGINNYRDYSRDSSWRPLRQEECITQQEQPESGLSYFHKALEESPRYYWLKDN